MEEKTIKILVWIIIIIFYFIISALTKKKKTPSQSQSQTPNKTSHQKTISKGHEIETKTNNLPQEKKHRTSKKIEKESEILEKIIDENEDRSVLKGKILEEDKKKEKKQKIIFTKQDIKKAVILSDIIKPKYF